MGVIDAGKVEKETGSIYPEPFASQMGKRTSQALGEAAGLTRFGVNLVTMHPRDKSSLRHWHSDEDEFVWVLSGELVLVQDAGETVLKAGQCAGFKAGDPDGHHLVNRSKEEAQFLVVGSRQRNDTCTYSDEDLVYKSFGDRSWFTRHDGTPLKD